MTVDQLALPRLRVIGVLDVAGGRAVHAQGGVRDRYVPVGTIGDVTIAPGDAVAMARTYLDELGLAELYVADLDAIRGRAPHDGLVRELAGLGAPLWLDAGVSSPAEARHARALGVSHVVVGLETLRSYDDLGVICASEGGAHVAFSLDLRDGIPTTAAWATGPRAAQRDTAEVVATRAAEAGVGAIIVLDLARVGSRSGPDLDLIARIRNAAPGVALLVGGGVRDASDLARLANAGCDGALVATALLDGGLNRDDVASSARGYS